LNMGKKKKRQATCEQASTSTRRKDKWQKNGKTHQSIGSGYKRLMCVCKTPNCPLAPRLKNTMWAQTPNYPLAPRPCQAGSKPAGRGSFERHTEAPAAGRGLNWSRRGRRPPLKFYVWPYEL
jgi:hypothetical protein